MSLEAFSYQLLMVSVIRSIQPGEGREKRHHLSMVGLQSSSSVSTDCVVPLKGSEVFINLIFHHLCITYQPIIFTNPRASNVDSFKRSGPESFKPIMTNSERTQFASDLASDLGSEGPFPLQTNPELLWSQSMMPSLCFRKR